MYSKTIRINRGIMIVPNERGELVAVNTITGRALRTTTHIYAILETFSVPSTIESALNKLAPALSVLNESGRQALRQFIDKMCEHGLLVSDDSTELAQHDLNYFGAYQHLRHQREMLMDSPRTLAFMKAIEELVSPNDIVFDVGCGSGILSLFAARKGARKIYAIERSNVINIARKIAEVNGYAHQITFAQCMAESFACTDKATVIVSEWLGAFVLRELMFKSFCSVRDGYATAETKCIPSRVRMYIAPVEDAGLWQTAGPGYWTQSVYGFDFTPAHDTECARLGSAIESIPETSLLSERELVHDVDCTTAASQDFYFESRVELVACRKGALHGYAGSFDMQLSPSVWLDTGSHSQATHWKQLFFPLTGVIPVEKGDQIVVTMRATEPDNPQKRIPDFFLSTEIFRDANCIYQESNWYDRARGGVF